MAQVWEGPGVGVGDEGEEDGGLRDLCLEEGFLLPPV